MISIPAAAPDWTAASKPAGMTAAASASPASMATRAASSSSTTVTSAIPASSSAARGPLRKAADDALRSRSTKAYSALNVSSPLGRRRLKMIASPSGATIAMMIALRSRIRSRRSLPAMTKAARIVSRGGRGR